MPKKIYCLGVWDLMHVGHCRLLENASKHGILNVGVVCDQAVKLQKGKDRPIVNEKDRMYIVSQNKHVDKVELVYGFYFPKEAILWNDFIVIGEDQTHLLNIQEVPESKIIRLSRTPGVSTSEIVNKLGPRG